MENYKLQSCDLTRYPDILFVCWTHTHPFAGDVVYINSGLVDQSKTYLLVYLGTDVEVCSNYLPSLAITTENTCSPSYGIFDYKNCETNVIRSFGFPLGDPVNNVMRKNGDCDCWEFVGAQSAAMELVTAYSEYDDCSECLSTRASELCPHGERSVGFCVRVSLPPSPPPDRGFSRCCYTNVVLADLSDSDPYKNDFSGAFFKRETPSSTCVFKLVDTATATEYFLNSNTYGTYQDFGGIQDDLTFYVVEWAKVLNLLGVGTYQIKKELDIAGVSVDVYSNTFVLKPFSIDNAEKTVRLDSNMNGKLVKIDTDFSGSGYTTSVRLRGFFGRAERSFTQDNLSRRDYNIQQNTMSSKTEYQFQGLQIPECITSEIWDFVLFGDELFISDYNKNNHSYKYEVLPVVLSDNSGTEFFVSDRAVNLNLVFTDRFENNRKTNC